MSHAEKQYPRLGEQIDRLIRSLAAVKGWNMTRTMVYVSTQTHYGTDMLHRWRQGKICPRPEILEILAQIGKEEARLPREWGESLLNAAHYSDTMILVNKLWGPKDIRTIPCNLPPRDRDPLVGRDAEMAHLLKLLSPKYAAPLITIDGIGGVGKTALVLEVAHRCWKASIGENPDPKVTGFDAIIFISAKQQYLTPDGILRSNEAKRTLRDMFREIASTLDRFDITHATPQEQLSAVRRALGSQRTLLIVDNLETMEDKQEIISFLYELPQPVKIVITTRERVLTFSPIRLDELPLGEALNLIEKEAQEKGTEVSQEQALRLYRNVGGIPAALVYAIGQIAGGYSVQAVLEKMPKSNSDVAHFCFEGSLGPLRGRPAHYLLMAMAMFSKPPMREALICTAGLKADQIAVEEALAQLLMLSLIKEREKRYTILPLTREYVLSELASFVSFEQEARSRWIEWYLKFTFDKGGKDWEDWYIRYKYIEEEWENLLTIFDWCAVHEQYDVIQKFWQERELVKFAQIYGYWEDRLFWLDWIIQAAEKRGEWSAAVKAMVDIGSTFTLMGKFEDAERYFQKALKILPYAVLAKQLLLFQKLTDLYIQQKKFVDALYWLDRAQQSLRALASEDMDKREYTRRQVDFQSHQALFFYKQKDYDRAKSCYQEIIDQAQAIGMQRVTIFAQNHLAYIAIAQDQLDAAETLLQMALPVSEDKRLTAFHKHTLAYFYFKKDNIGEASRLAKEAREEFELLGMKPDAKEVDELLHQLQ